MSDLRVRRPPPICDYEGSDYQAAFWDQGHREYEDRVEEIALRRLLPQSGKLLLELGAGAGRNTARYIGFERRSFWTSHCPNCGRLKKGWVEAIAICMSRGIFIVCRLQTASSTPLR